MRRSRIEEYGLTPEELGEVVLLGMKQKYPGDEFPEGTLVAFSVDPDSAPNEPVVSATVSVSVNVAVKPAVTRRAA